MLELLQDAEFWVGVALVVFVGGLIWVGVPRMAAAALDAKAQRIKDQLIEAGRLGAEAEKLLASIKLEREAAESQAAQMLADAQEAAEQYAAEARIKMAEQVARRAEMAKRKIAQAEAQATAEVRAAAVDLAAHAAETVLKGRVGATKGDALIDRGVEQLAAKLG